LYHYFVDFFDKPFNVILSILGKIGDKKMMRCDICSKKLCFKEDCQYPTIGETQVVCRNCYDRVSTSVEIWKKLFHANSFNTKISKNTLQLDMNNKIMSYIQTDNVIDNIL
jgi:hypothetical protein